MTAGEGGHDFLRFLHGAKGERKYRLGLLLRWAERRPWKDENPTGTNHAHFTACDYNIELIFKSWKSYLHVAVLQTTKEASTLGHLYGRMLLIRLNDALCPQRRAALWEKKQREMSVRKLVRHCQAFAERWMQVIFQSTFALRRLLQQVCATAERLVGKALRKRRTTAQLLRESVQKQRETVVVRETISA